MWYAPPKYIKPVQDINEEIKKIHGEMDDKTAKITLAKFLYQNIGVTTEILTGVELYPDQIISIKGMMKSNYTLCVWGRGVSKSWTAAVYCILQCIFEPGTRIIVAGPTFRTARFIFNNIEKIVESNDAQMLFSAMGVKNRRNDEFKWAINGGEIIAIPLSGEKVRGFRANILVIDEFLLMGEEIVERVLIPFLAVPQDLKRRKRITAKENQLIEQGLMTESERTLFKYKSKLIGLSSASYKCEYLYRKFEDYCKLIYDPKMPETGERYFVSQLAYDAVPLDRIDRSIINLAKSNEASSANFQREYCAQFLDGSDSYFSMNKMLACSVPDGDTPTLLIRGAPNKKYILAIDPNASNSETADHFAMCVIELDESDPTKPAGTIVHSYAEAGKDLKDHIRYYYYLLTNFNVEMIIIDHAGYQFIESANESELLREKKIDIKIFEFSPEKDGVELEEELKKARRAYNKQMQVMAFTQYFTSDFIRKGNEWLQGCIDFKKIYFGSPIKAHEGVFNASVTIPLDEKIRLSDKELDKDESFSIFFIDHQDTLIKQTRYQCAAIEVKSTIKGTQTFDLPQIMKRDTSAHRQRRDSYTALLLGAWGIKCYWDIMRTQEEAFHTFEPMMV